jgi:serine-type D-Ala-D-Ala carboxypeptidase (penicillin-binding protein 5/6)
LPAGRGTGADGLTSGFTPSAKEWLLADADNGRVLGASGDHLPVRPASVAKIITGYLAMKYLPATASVPVGGDAAGEEAMKMNMKVGQVWPLDQTLHALLMVSANDAAVALADRVSDSPPAFGELAGKVAGELGATDPLVFDDPAGLDDSFQVGQGDLISAYDLAVFARAAMTIPEFRTIVDTQHYVFQGVDGDSHELPNHNKLLAMDPTVIGIKPGYTSLAGETLVTEATRDGRTMLVVLLGDNAATLYSDAEGLFNQGFATTVTQESAQEQLPAVRTTLRTALRTPASRASAAASSAARSAKHSPAGHPYNWKHTEILLVGGLLGGVYLRRRSVLRQRRARGSFRPISSLS